MNDYRELAADVERLINKGDLEKNGEALILTKEGRTEALMRWRGLCGDAQILCSLWLKERYDKLNEGGSNAKANTLGNQTGS